MFVGRSVKRLYDVSRHDTSILLLTIADDGDANAAVSYPRTSVSSFTPSPGQKASITNKNRLPSKLWISCFPRLQCNVLESDIVPFNRSHARHACVNAADDDDDVMSCVTWRAAVRGTNVWTATSLFTPRIVNRTTSSFSSTVGKSEQHSTQQYTTSQYSSMKYGSARYRSVAGTRNTVRKRRPKVTISYRMQHNKQV